MDKVRKFSVAIWTPSVDLTTGQAIVTRSVINALDRDDIDVATIQFRNGLNIYAIFSWLIASLSLYQKVFIKRFRTVYIVSSRSLLGSIRDLPALILSLLGVKIIAHIHGDDLQNLFNRPLVGRIFHNLYKRTKKVIVPSSHLLDTLSNLNLPLALCPNFTDIKCIQDQDTAQRLKGDRLLVLWNSNIMVQKGFLEFADAVQSLTDGFQDIQFIICGSTVYAPKSEQMRLKAAIERLSMNPNVTYLGRTSQSDLKSLLTACHAMILPSHKECQPLALIEAMVAGLAVVSTRIPGISSTLGAYPATLIEIGSSSGIEMSIRALRKDFHDNRYRFVHCRLSCAELASTIYNPDRFKRHMLNIIQNI